MPTITITQITSVSLSPNPADMNTPLSVAVTVTETIVTLMPEITYSGDSYSGETYSQGG